VQRYFVKHHPDFFDPQLWQSNKELLLRGELPDFFPYDVSMRFCVRYPERFAAAAATADAGDAVRVA
jgi:isocitrate dehydrogenase kinase/phosphatase